MNPLLYDIHQKHSTLVSDKWSSYLYEYQRILSPYQDQAVTILEIGVQNGGSLEIWSKFFPNARKIIGCDIDTNCSKLNFASPKIELVIGDITSETTSRKILTASENTIDIIIDDGSHISSDIISTFLNLFDAITPGGIYIAEDLHCSYWPEFEGGLSALTSSINFFKTLCDVVNFEHWGVTLSRESYLKTKFSVPDNCEATLSSIHSIEFVNSMCIIKKSTAQGNSLGPRLVRGTSEIVFPVKHKDGEHLKI